MLMASCTNQETLVPQDGPAMKDIYRNVLDHDPGESTLYQSEAKALCEVIQVSGNLKSCVRKANKILIKHRLTPHRNADKESLSYIPYTREQQSELDNLFPRLPNPDLVIYVYPHLATRSRAPIPGYSTVIPLYERVQYRLPGESLNEE